MREGEFRLLQARNAKREMLVLNQWEFLESRQRALELVLEGQSIWDRIAILMGRKSLKEAVDAAHLVLFKASQEARKEMTKKAKEEASKEAVDTPHLVLLKKPKLIVPNGNGAIHV